MNFIKLTLPDNIDVIVNFDLVTSFNSYVSYKNITLTHISFDADNYFYVQEAPEDILDKLGLLK